MQLILIPILYIVQELTIRLGAVTGKGHAELIKLHFGIGWAWLSVATLIITCLGALLTEFAGLAGVGNLRGLARRLRTGGPRASISFRSGVGVQVMNALLLPIVLGFLFLLARRLPPPYRLQGAHAAASGAVILATVVFGVYSGVAGLWG